tara:strand:- start:313 stop:1068 length:756 start_codon:yes stop_codon:yes gene_type:complete
LKKHFYISAFILLAIAMTHNLSFAGDQRLSFSVPPFSPFNGFDEQSQCKGIGVLAIEKVTNTLNTPLKLAAFPYARILNSLKNGELDLALLFKNNTVTEDVEYIGPLSLEKIFILTQPDTTIKQYKDLYQLTRIAVIRSAQFNKKFDQDKRLNKISVNSYNQAIRLLKLNRINAVIGSKVGLEYALYQEKVDEDIMANAFYLGTKELGLHLAKKSPFISMKPLLEEAVKEAYQDDLLEQLYRQQMQYCANL